MRRWVYVSLLLVGCEVAPVTPPAECLESIVTDGVPVARVGTTPITMAQLLERIREQGPLVASSYSSSSKLRRFVEDQVRFELLVRAALERGYHRDPEVVEAAQKVMVRKLLNQDLGDKVFEGQASERAILSYYERHKEEYIKPEKRRVAHIQLPRSNEGRATAQSLINRLNGHPADRELFARLAKEYSGDWATNQQRGALQFLTHQELVHQFGETFAASAFRLDSGQTSASPVESRHGWHVVRLEARREMLNRSLDEVREEIRDKLLRDRRSSAFDDYLGEIRKRHPVILYDQRIDDLRQALKTATEESSR